MVATEIIPNLWLGDIRSALDNEFIVKNKINVIINCTTKYPFTKIKGHAFKKIRVAVRDRGIQEDIDDMHGYLIEVVPMIYSMLQNNECILIHCYAGCHRSVTLVLGFLLKYSNLTLQQSIDTLHSKWPRLGLNFLSSLIDYNGSISKQQLSM